MSSCPLILTPHRSHCALHPAAGLPSSPSNAPTGTASEYFSGLPCMCEVHRPCWPANLAAQAYSLSLWIRFIL